MNTICVIQARMGSTRLPGKVLLPLISDGVRATVLEYVVRACTHAVGIDQVIVATTDLPSDNPIEQHCKYELGVTCVRGSENDVLSRFMLAAVVGNADTILRVTGDEPFIDPAVISAVVRLQAQSRAHYVSNIQPRTYPDGLDVECFTIQALKAAHKEATRDIDRETVTYWMMRNADRFPSATVVNPLPGMAKERWVLDTFDDMKFCMALANRLPWLKGPASMFDILDILDKEPELRALNPGIMNERFFEALGNEPAYSRSRLRTSARMSQAVRIIPLGCQTFSKSHIQFPGNNPLFLSHGKGAYVYDVDGNEYVDLMGALLPNILGMCDPDVDYAIRSQLNKGISFSLATKLEAELASRLVRLIPCADMVRFGKNGSDVTSAAVRLARAFTHRDMVLSSGYHGWSDVFVGIDPMRGLGVPDRVAKLTWPLKHGDSEQAIKLIKSKLYACVIVEPETDPEFLQVLRDICTETSTVLIFDEIITFPRWSLGGAQKHWGITPDLATVSKAIANGMPLSAIVGKKEIMKLLEPPDNIFFSGTFGGETLSIAAAIATLDKLERENVVENLRNKNASLAGECFNLAQRYDAPVSFALTPGLTRISFKDTKGATKEQLGVLFRQEMAANGVLIINAHALSHAHGPNEMKRVVTAYESTFKTIQEAVAQGSVASRVGGAVLSQAANVR